MPHMGEVVVHPGEGLASARVELRGEFDIDDTAWRAPIEELIAAGGAPQLELDLSGVEFADSSFLRGLYRLHRQAADRGGQAVVTDATPLMMRLLQVTELEELLCSPELVARYRR